MPRTVRLPLREHERGEQHDHADDDEAVGEVERRPPLQVDEVGDVAEPHPVDEVRDAAADHERETDRQHGMARAAAREVDEHPDDRERGEDDHHRGRLREQAERDARVLHVADPERPDDVDALVELQLPCDDVLGQLVRRDGGERDREQREPVARPGAEPALADEDRRRRVRRRADADVALAHARCSWARASSMQSDAHGIASSRSSPICLPQTVHVP